MFIIIFFYSRDVFLTKKNDLSWFWPFQSSILSYSLSSSFYSYGMKWYYFFWGGFLYSAQTIFVQLELIYVPFLVCKKKYKKNIVQIE